MGHYRFINLSKSNQPTAEQINNAATLTNVADMLKVSKAIGEYVFEESKDLEDAFRKASAISIERKISDNGIKSYRAVITTDSGKFFTRLYGAGRGADYVERDLSADEIKKAVFGFCKSDGETITETRQGDEGIVKCPVFYLKLEA